jgi:membrane-associated HD superfamily phosphohydrolase
MERKMLSLIVEQEKAHMKIKLLRQIKEVKRTAQRKEEENTHIYIKRNVRVCKDFFLSKLGISEHMVYNWLDRNTDSNGLPQPKSVSKRTPPLTRISTEWKNAEAFLDSLPKMESHYCRAATSKIYLEPVFVSCVCMKNIVATTDKTLWAE